MDEMKKALRKIGLSVDQITSREPTGIELYIRQVAEQALQSANPMTDEARGEGDAVGWKEQWVMERSRQYRDSDQCNTHSLVDLLDEAYEAGYRSRKERNGEFPMTLVERLYLQYSWIVDSGINMDSSKAPILLEAADHIESLQRECDALRSVLSEWDQDKSCFIQWNRANDFRDQREGKRG